MKTKRSALSRHPLWKQLRKYIKIEKYAPDGGHARPRIRIEWYSDMPPELQHKAVVAHMPCVACGAAIHFIRRRGKAKRGSAGHLYYACSCPLNVNIACSRGAAARDEYDAVRMEGFVK